MAKKLLIATRNSHKLKEINQILEDLGIFDWDLIDLDKAGVDKDFDVAETAQSYKDNVILKAKSFGKRAGILTLADDSGLEVDALGSRPGVYSARYGKDSQHRNTKLLTELEGVDSEQRTARYRIVIALFNPIDDSIQIFEGWCEGVIATQPKGSHNFGYDPIFYYQLLDRHLAELSEDEKNKISHRRKALDKLVNYLASEFNLNN